MVELEALRCGELGARHDSVLPVLAVRPLRRPQWQAASIVDILIAVLSIAALAAFAVWEKRLNLVAGLGLIVSPWLLGFQNSDAMTIDVVSGVIVAMLAAFKVWLA